MIRVQLNLSDCAVTFVRGRLLHKQFREGKIRVLGQHDEFMHKSTSSGRRT